MQGVTLYDTLHDIVKYLRSNQITPIFIVDALRTQCKSKTQITRALSQYKDLLRHAKDDLQNTCQRLSAQELKKLDNFEENYRTKTANTQLWTVSAIFILRELGCQIYTPITDADSGTYKLAVDRAAELRQVPNPSSNSKNRPTSHKKVIILSNDSDFCLFSYPENVLYCMLRDFWHKMFHQIRSDRSKPFSIKCFHQHHFSNQLKLGVDKLFYLAFFTGNDFITGNKSLMANNCSNDFDKIWDFVVSSSVAVLENKIEKICQKKSGFREIVEQTRSFYGRWWPGANFRNF